MSPTTHSLPCPWPVPCLCYPTRPLPSTLHSPPFASTRRPPPSTLYSTRPFRTVSMTSILPFFPFSLPPTAHPSCCPPSRNTSNINLAIRRHASLPTHTAPCRPAWRHTSRTRASSSRGARSCVSMHCPAGWVCTQASTRHACTNTPAHVKHSLIWSLTHAAPHCFCSGDLVSARGSRRRWRPAKRRRVR